MAQRIWDARCGWALSALVAVACGLSGCHSANKESTPAASPEKTTAPEAVQPPPAADSSNQPAETAPPAKAAESKTAAEAAAAADHQALVELIRKRVEEAQAREAQQPTTKPAERTPDAQPNSGAQRSTTPRANAAAAATPANRLEPPDSTANRQPGAGVVPHPAAAAAAQPATQQPADPNAAAGSHGCGATGEALDLNPPPPDAPQPQYVCNTPRVTAEPIWKGESVTFKFTIANGGQAPLNVMLKGG